MGVRPLNKFMNGPYDGHETEDVLDLVVTFPSPASKKTVEVYRLLDMKPDGTRIYAHEGRKES